ncbi:hypothetical protein MRB53_020693 [Persea americana]|uniref:Uncharacterized protein n=1 Tax=Persea americana TaxID=3435 RepID=A0ACC2L1H1_PERAE|nr:hypothetical protein MRB53_020693 [Persea americana]
MRLTLGFPSLLNQSVSSKLARPVPSSHSPLLQSQYSSPPHLDHRSTSVHSGNRPPTCQRLSYGMDGHFTQPASTARACAPSGLATSNLQSG